MDLTLIAVGGAGGLLPDAIRVAKNRYDPAALAYLKTATFWIGLAILVILGALTAWLANATDVKQALAYGFGAPEFISRVLGGDGAAKSTFRSATTTATHTLRTWWAA